MTIPRRGWLLGLATAALAGCGGSAHSTAAAAPSPRFAPYADVTLASGSATVSQARAAHLRALTLAFVVAAGQHDCRATWGGQPLTSVSKGTTAALRSAGITPAISFGGQAGPELARACATTRALTAQYQAVVKTYRPARLDFDIEGAFVGDASANARRWAAIRSVLASSNRAGHPLAVTLTLPVLPTGLDPGSVALVRGALRAGIRPTWINLLAMDYGPDYPSSRSSMSAYAQRAASAARRQLRTSWSAIGVTVMIGVNDTPGETFTLGDAASMSSFAASRGLGALSMWSLNRDRPCPVGTPAGAQDSCSGVAQAPLQFARTLGR